MNRRIVLAGLTICFLAVALAHAQSDVTTYHYDNGRTGANLHEIILTPQNTVASQFGKLCSYSVDGQIYAEPLYAANVQIPGRGIRNVVYVATEHDSVYALDADGKSSTPLWHVSFIDPANGVTTVPNTVMGSNYHDFEPEIGITGTPVIDPTSGTLYVVAMTSENSGYVQRLHALDIATGAERTNSPVVIQASVASTKLLGRLVFSPGIENQRPALLLLNGTVYIAWGSFGDLHNYHGWVIAYDEQSLAQAGAFSTTPNASYGGIWQAGGGLAADSYGTMYVTSGNGAMDANSGGSDYAGSLLKLSSGNSGISVIDYFLPAAADTLNGDEMSSGGPLLLPDQPGNFPHLMIVAAKDTNLYLLNRDSLGGANPSSSQLVERVAGAFTGGVFSTPAFWQNNVYFWAATDHLRAFTLSNGRVSSTPTAIFPLMVGFPGAGLAVSANGAQGGILWALDSHLWGTGGPAVLHAFDATNIARELYNSSQAGSRDTAGPAVKFTVPTVANGKVYVGTADELDIYGLLSAPSPTAPTFAPLPGTYTAPQTVVLSDSTPGTTVFCTTDGSIPTTLSPPCTSLVLSTTTTIRAIATVGGYGSSSTTSGTYKLNPGFNLIPVTKSATVAPGQIAQFTLQISGAGGAYGNPVSLSCSGAPPQSSCSLSPVTVTPGSSTVNVQLNVSTTGPTANILPNDRRGTPLYALVLGLPLLGLAFGGSFSWKKKLAPWALICLLATVVALQWSCGGAAQSTAGTAFTPAGTYLITVNGTSSAQTHSVSVTLTVE